MPEESAPICIDGFELRFTYATPNTGEFFRIDVGNVNHYQVTEPFDPSSVIIIDVIPYSRIHGNRVDVQPVDCLNAQNGSSVMLVSVDCPELSPPIDTFICQGEDFVWDGNVFTEPGVYEIPYLDSLDCDSTLTLNLQWFEPPAQTIIDTLLASGDEFEGINYVSDTIFTTLFASANGCDSIVTYVINIVTDVENPDEGMLWQVYPNPAADEVFVAGKYAWSAAILYDLQGRVVRNWQGDYAAGRQRLDVRNLMAGMYLLRLQGEEAQAVLRVVLE